MDTVEVEETTTGLGIMNRRQRRQARALTRPGTGLSDTFIPELNRRLAQSLHEWHAHYEDELNSEASHKLFAADFLHRLQTGKGTLSASHIVEFARNGHAAAHCALRDFIDLAMSEHRYPELPMPVQEYARWLVSRTTAPPTGYPSNAPR